MRVKFHSNLWYGDFSECASAEADAVMHCCKSPCHATRNGAKPDLTGPKYLTDEYQENGREHIALNMIDPPTPLFKLEMFEKALLWARRQLNAGKKITLHCNEGKSRAPSMAIVIGAHLLGIYPRTSFKDAIDEFEHQTGISYRPGEGIKLFLKENWEALSRCSIMSFAGEIPEPAPVKEETFEEMQLPETEEEIRAFIKSSVLTHFTACTKIEDKKNKWIQPIPNALQFEIAEAYDWCIENNVPCRLIILKPRQVGCSTFVGQLTYHHMRRFQQNMMIMGDVTKRTEAVYRLFNRISENDSFQWDSRYQFDTRKGTFLYADNQKGKVMFGTANDPKAGISETRQVVWMTEAARYAKTGVRTDTHVITALLNSLANEPNTLGVAESTAEGANGWFYGTYKGAVALEDRKKGKIGNGWIKIFAPWYAFPEHSLPRNNETNEWFERDLDDRERQGIEKYGWNASQIAWRRRQIKQACNNDPRMFDQDYPEDSETCFLASGRPRFHQPGLNRLEKMAESLHPLGRRGILVRTDLGRVVFQDAAENEAWCWVAEEPTVGLSYIAAIDPCTGAQSEGSAYPDAHGAGVLRVGYYDDAHVWHNDTVAATVDVENGCRWDDSLIGERMKLLTDYYGGCMVVPETGNGLGVLNVLQREGCRIYRRRKHDAMHPGKVLEVIGWETNADTRPLWVGAAADAIRDETVDIGYLPIVRESQTFYINDRGRAEAKPNCHDDWVAWLGIALYCKNFADKLPPPKPQWSPTDGGPPRAYSAMGNGAFS